MSDIQFQIANGPEYAAATIIIDGETHNYLSTQPNWEKVVKVLTDSITNPPADAEKLLTLIAPGRGLDIKFKRISDRFVFRKGHIFFDGVKTEGAIVDHLRKIIVDPKSKDEDYQYLVRFTEKLYTNPSKTSIESLYFFLNDHGMMITEDGDFVAYKGVLPNYGSISAGPGIVNGEEFEVSHHLDNSIGNVVEMPRANVNDNRNVACSVGLHAGSYEYANDFRKGHNGKLVHVKINPRDVVSVPSDSGNAKIRVSRYEVIGEGDDKLDTPTYRVAIPGDEPEVEETPEPEVEQEVLAAEDVAEFPAAEQEAASAEQTVDPNSFEGRVARMRVVIQTLPKGTNLKRYRNKNVTAKNRLPFDEALKRIEDEA